MWLVLLIMSLPCSAKVQTIKAGSPAPDDGYFMTLGDGRDMLKMIQTYRAERDALNDAYLEVHNEFVTTVEEHKTALEGIKADIDTERRAWQAQRRRDRNTWLVVGLIIGAGVGLSQ